MQCYAKLTHLWPLCQAGSALLALTLLLGACRPASQGKQGADPQGDSTAQRVSQAASRTVDPKSPSSIREQGLQGDYVYFAEVATFQPCAGGQAMPIAPDSVALQLERRYLQDGPGGPRPMLVELLADTVMAEDPSGRRRAQWRVREVLAVMPGEHCP